MVPDRRNFLKQTALIGSALCLPSLPSFSAAAATTQVAAGFQLLIMATSWGFHGSVDQFCGEAKKAGYDGIEVWWPAEKAAQDELFAALAKHQLQVGYLCGGSDSDYSKHAAQFKGALEAAVQSKQKPLYINCHSGRDYFTFDQNAALIDFTTGLSKKSGIPIYHETHRSRMLFAAHIARQFIAAKPDLRLTLDISHWCNVHETLLHDQPEAVASALERTSHIHARIGHQEGPQVNDPRAPEWESAVNAHFDWWDQVVKRHQAAGKPLTILTEFGPVDYLPALPYTRQPVANQWEINVYMMNQLKQRYSKK
ncbi:TIM barrel protein [Chitinophaga sp. MM2321]|uniref:sugar phosphate isomerase/epimerase family protein n=1 Tax=Chitinophaga sp. MM2321 TaxID=3137178 RepID=UPI0032D5AF1A